MKVKTTGSKLPHAWVVSPKDKGRRKIYNDNKIFLQNGEEFAIELYNPTQTNVVALINLDGKPISSSGLVIRAGERIYLDCFMDDLKKFIFDTYEVEDTEESNDAISNNGLLEVYFYNELIIDRVDLTKIPKVQEHHHHYHHHNYNYPTRWYPYYGDIWCGSTGTLTTNLSNTTTYTTSLYNSGVVGTNLTGSIDATSFNDVSINSINVSSNDSKIETGQTVKGDDSLQKFKEIDMALEEEHVSTITYTLLPESRMPKDSKDVSKASMERISDRLSEGKHIGDLTSRIYTFYEMKNNKFIEEDEFELIRSKTVSSIIELSSKVEITVDDLANHIFSLGELMQQKLITEDDFKLIKSNLFNSIK